MTNTISAASLAIATYLATNLNIHLSQISGFCLTNNNSYLANVSNACLVKRKMTCPHCGNVSTNDVDVTDLHDYYENLERRMIESDNRLLLEAYKSGYTSGLNDMKDAATREIDALREDFRRAARK